jgi:hypothetical protein
VRPLSIVAALGLVALGLVALIRAARAGVDPPSPATVIHQLDAREP